MRVSSPPRWFSRGLRLACITLFAAAPLAAQVAVLGEVRDSLTGKPFVGALVQLVPSATPWSAGVTATSDSAGRFTLSDVAPGRYTIGFQHPRLDSLGFDAVTRVLDIMRNRTSVTANLALPSAATLHSSLCGAARDTTGAIIGRVREAESDTAAVSTVVVAEWAELVVGAGGLQRSARQVTRGVGRDGRYVLCGVPTDVAVQLRAVSADSVSPIASGTLELRFGDGAPLVHRDLLVASNPAAPALGSARRLEDSLPATALPGRSAPATRSGTARLSGIIVDQANAPVAGARVAISEAGAATTTGPDGAFRLRDLPAGSFGVQVIAIGFAPARSAAALRSEREAELRLTLSKAVPTLDSVTVFSSASTDRVGFASRRAKGVGYFMTAEQIRLTGVSTVGASLRMAPSLRSVGGTRVGGRGGCQPVLYLNGLVIDAELGFEAVSPASIDHIVPLAQVGGIEVYSNPADMPAQFGSPGGQRQLSSAGCSVVAIWTKEFVPERP